VLHLLPDDVVKLHGQDGAGDVLGNLLCFFEMRAESSLDVGQGGQASMFLPDPAEDAHRTVFLGGDDGLGLLDRGFHKPPGPVAFADLRGMGHDGGGQLFHVVGQVLNPSPL
jgi:hypothetical protein